MYKVKYVKNGKTQISPKTFRKKSTAQRSIRIYKANVYKNLRVVKK